MKRDFDIDIDVADRGRVLAAFPAAVPASTNQGEGKHHAGVYFTDIPVNPLTGRAAIDFNEAKQRGYFKIDILNVHIYSEVRDPAHLDELMAQEPDWDLLTDRNFTRELFQMGERGRDLEIMKPRSIEQLAMFLAAIRPAKRHLIGSPWGIVRQTIWDKPANGAAWFKKPHAVAYAHAVAVHMNLLRAQWDPVRRCFPAGAG